MRKTILFNLFLFSAFIVLSQQPVNLNITNINTTDVNLTWDNGGCSANYTLRIRVDGASSWQSGISIPNTGSSETYNLTGLLSSTTYNWKIKCGGGGNWTNGPNFTTPDSCNLISSILITDASCNNTMNGNASLTISGGAAPYNFSWDNGDTTQNINGVIAGTYIVQITDNAGCTTSDTAVIGSIGTQSINQQLTQFSPNPITAYHQWSYDTLRITNTGCDVRIRPEFSINCSTGPIQQGDIVIKWQHPLGYNQSINYNIDGSGNAYGYWSFTANDSTGTDITFGQIQDLVIRVKFVNPAQYGNYTATWETFQVDNQGNKLGVLAPSNNVTLSLVTCSLFSIDSTSTTSTTCVGGTDGSASIQSVTNNSGQYSYNWSTGSTQSSINNVAAGTYSCVVTDDIWGCVDSVEIIVPSADSLQVSLTGTNISCFGLVDGTLTGSASGGSGTYQYTWNPSLPLTATHTGLSSNTYVLELIDMGCPNSSATASFSISEPALLSYTTTSNNNTSCDTSICNGSLGMTLTGGTTPYIYTWNNGDSVNFQNNLCPGSYSITSTDANSCNTFTENVIVYDSSSTLSVLFNRTDVSCFGQTNGSAEAMISMGGGGNVSTLTYCNSNPGATDYSSIDRVRLVGDNDSISNNTLGQCDSYEDYTLQYTTLTPGNTYTVDVDLGTCTPGLYSIDSVKVFIDWNIDGDFTDVGETIGSFGGQSPASYSITFLTPSIAYGPTRMRVVSQYSSFGPVSSCDVGTWAPTYNPPWYGATEDYSIVISGSAPATFLWNTGDTTSTITNLSAGIYYCEVTDTNNCIATDTVTIVEPSIISTTENITNVSCNGGSDGFASLNINGGSPGYTQDWGGINPNALSVGTYNYTIIDTNGCVFSDSVTITQPNTLSISSITTDVLCNGDASGSIDITIDGGTSSYIYSWSNGSNSEDLINALAGTYYLQVTDANSCILLDTFIITETSAIVVTESTTNTSCNGFSDGTATLSISGGTPNYTEDWGTNNPSNLSAGTYSYSVIDSNSCIYTNTITITEPNVISTNSTITNVSCNGDNDGNATLSISGGTPGYSEDWGTNNPDSLSEGTYSYTITDTNGCTFSDSVTITEPQILSASYTQTNVSCNGFIDGSASVIITGGTTNYILSWDTLTYPLLGGVNIFNTPVGVPAGMYPFGISDANGCAVTDTITITEPPLISVTESTTNVSCYGLSDGTATISISGGTPTYIEDWGTNNPNALSAGTYNYTVTDGNSCIYINSLTITEPNELSSTISATDLTSCLISNGTIDLSVNGGTSPYYYLWNNNDTTEDLSNLSAGNYSVTITDENGCLTTNNTTVNQPSNGLAISLISPTYNGFEISCYGGSNGSITTTTAGGVGNLSFVWSNGDSTQNLSNLIAGTYSVTMTDSIGCSLFDNITLNEPSVITSIYSTTDVLCNGDSSGSATVTISGGIPTYFLEWGGNSIPNVGLFYTGNIVPEGVYPYSITDLNGCNLYDTITITEPSDISTSYITSNYNGYNISCNSNSDGSIDLTTIGGTPPYSFSWNNGMSTENISSLNAGTYLVSITDSLGCTHSASLILNEPSNLTLSLSSVNNSCFNSCDGIINTQIFGGVAPYTYLWDNGTSLDSITNVCSGNYNIIVTDTNGCTISDNSLVTQPTEIIINTDSIIEVSFYDGNDGEIYITASGGMNNYSYSWSGPNGYISNSEDINGISSGIYWITVSDSTSCWVSDSIFVDQPSSLTINLDTIINLICFEECNGQIMITADGGDSVYTYLWSGPNGFNSTDEDLDSLCAGTYELTLSDSSNSVFASFTITQPSQLQIITNADTALCYGGLAQATAYSYGGQYPYTTTWDIGSSSITTSLSAGLHYVNVIDANGCSATDSILIIQNDSMLITTTTTDITCFGLTDGTAQIDVQSGGLSPFDYSNDNGQTFQSLNIFNGIPSGTSTYIVRDANGCTISASATITEPDELVVQLDADSASCYGECDGSATVSASGGTGIGTYTEDWGGLDPNNLCAGLVNVIVQDSNNCLATNSIIITEPNPVIVIISANGMVLEATSGFLSYQWIDENGDNILGATSQNFTPTSEGEYSVEVMDQNSCIGISNSVSYIIESIEDNNRILSVYPNPANDWITIETKENINNDLNIINIFGELIYTISSDKLSDNHEKINISELSKGMYIIQLINNKTIINHRIILQ